MSDEAIAAQVRDFQLEFARRLSDALGDRSLRAVAREAGLTHPTLHRLLRGNGVPDVETIIRLETVLGVRLWRR